MLLNRAQHITTHQLQIRQASPNDVLVIMEMHDRVSSASLQSRFLRPYTPTMEEIQRICHAEDYGGAAVVATMPDEIVVGYAYYEVAPGAITAEPAVLVEDQYQGEGVGSALMRRLYQIAAAKGVQAFDALIHPANERIMQLIRRSGLPFESRFEYGMREVRVWLNR
jgi:GNAT superfamily N-acetyltransferase